MQGTPFKEILYEVRDGIAVITLNRPDKLNSFTARMHEEMRAALAEVEKSFEGSEPIRVLVITGAGRGFCAGQDLSERKRASGEPPPDLGRSLRANYNPLITKLAQLPVPVIAAVNGIAAGSGANLALACDIVIAAKSAVFLQPFCQIGLIPDAGGTWSLPHAVGMARAKGLTFLAERLSAEQAAQWGLIWQAVDDEALMPTVRELAERLAIMPTRSFALQKQAYLASSKNSLSEQLELEAELQANAAKTDDYREGVASFFEKRKAVFKGR
jgi:2-(1,2-epoxy-1,2-dihydrophenyl)acetyl-CoA isomerase